jgi:hypothetical protein
LAMTMPGGVNFHDMQSSSSELSSSSSGAHEQMAQQIQNMIRLKARRTSIDLLGLAFGDSALLRNRAVTVAPMHPHHHRVDICDESA